MIYPFVSETLCISCTPCKILKVCKTRALMQIDPEEPPIVAVERCSGCAACVSACPNGAVILRASWTDDLCEEPSRRD